MKHTPVLLFLSMLLAACAKPTCGDGEVDLDEQCDDGNDVDGDGCRADCTVESCGDGHLDAGEQCDDANNVDGDGCLADCTLPSCGDGVLDAWEACDEGEGNLDEPDAACRPDCQLPTCGDGIADLGLGEACDDGNLVSGDGCTPDCRVEACGDGELDLGEACDDGNALSHDGCASDCTVESRLWSAYAPSDQLPYFDEFPALVADSARGQVVAVFPDGGMWRLDAAGWQLLTEESPRFPVQPRCAERTATQEIVCVGGGDDVTWVWDGRTWRQVDTASAPPARYGGSFVYDPVRDEMVLHGGGIGDAITTAAVTFDDTWVFDGEAWTERVASGAPKLLGRGCAFDYARGVLTCYGGADPDGWPDPATWTWDGAAWTRHAPNTEPPQVANAYWDRDREAVVVLGTDGAWSWNGTAWSQVSTNTGLFNSEIVYDPARGVWLSLRGLGLTAWDGDSATDLVLSPQQPPQRSYASTAYWGSRGELLLAGGASGVPNLTRDLLADGANFRTDLWAFGPAGWRSLGAGPSGGRAGMAWDRSRDRVVFFPDLGGATREWDGTAWSTDGGSSTLKYTALAWDPQVEAVIRTGGVSGLLPGLPDAPGDPPPAAADNETWSWDGAIWTGLGATASPGGDVAADMGLHEVLGEVFVAGGIRSTGSWGGIDDSVWRWDGTDWSGEVAPIGPEVMWSAMGYDAHRQRLVRTGGTTGNALHTVGWELNEANGWEPFALTPTGTAAHTMGWHALLRRMVLVDTQGGTWLTGYGPVLEACTTGLDGDGDGLVGCDDPDCWGYCSPECAPGTTCDASAPGCGDGTCDSVLESARLCPEDCGTPAAVCGDAICDPGETCPGDCP